MEVEADVQPLPPRADVSEVKEEQSLHRIDVTDENVPGVAAEGWAALRAVNREAHRPQFVRVGTLPCVRTEQGLEVFTPSTLTYWLARAAVFYKELKSGERIVKPPRWLVNDMLAELDPCLPEEGA